MKKKQLESSFEIRALKEDGREFTAIGVPYGEEIEIWGERERFEQGSIELNPRGVKTLILWQHHEPIGTVIEGRDTPEGFEIVGRLSDTTRGREAATLLKDGVITRMSIGFTPREYRIERDGENETFVYTKVDAHEFSLVSFPAYAGAAITDVRSTPETPETETQSKEKESVKVMNLTREDLIPFEQRFDDIDRELKNLQQSRAADASPQFRSAGDYLKKVAAGDDYALEFHRDFAGMASTDTIKNETYLGEFINFVHDRRTLINLFDTDVLPDEGMSVDYAQLATNTLQVGKQSKEGANLPGPGKVTLVTKSAKIETYGGWTELTRQVVERSKISYLDTVMKAMGITYAKETNDALREHILAVIEERASAGLTLTQQSVYDWRDAIIDAADYYTDNGFSLDGLLVSKDVFKALQRLEYTNVPALKVNPADEFSGTLNLPNADGELAGVPVRALLGSQVEANTVTFYDSTAIKTLENPNAPLQLQDDNIINLTRQFSLYGYMAAITPFPGGVLPVKLGG